MGERRIGDDVEAAPGQPQFGDVRPHHLDGVVVVELAAPSSDARRGWSSNAIDVAPALGQESRDDSVAGAEIEDQVTGPKPAVSTSAPAKSSASRYQPHG